MLPTMSARNTKRKLPGKLSQPVVKQSVKVVGKSNLDESNAIVSGGGNATKNITNGQREVVSISSDSSSSDGGEDGQSDEESADEAGADVSMEGVEVEAGAEPTVTGEEAGELSFGDLVRANASEEIIDVAGAFEDAESRALTFSTKTQPPSGASLGTVLTQALKTNDVSLLESCLHTTDVNTIRATIQRLDSTLAGILLQKLAERLHKRPGRAGSLMVWVQWSLVTHGGYLATQENLIKKLASLNKVIDERAKGLPSLLSLKGKLDMLEAQTELRRSMQNQRRRIDEEENADDVIYVEGEESEDEAVEVAKPKKLARSGDLVDISDHDSEVSEDMPNTNGFVADSEEEESSEGENFLDEEAEETDADENEVDHDDMDTQGEEDESEDAGPPPKLQRTSGVLSKKR